MTAGAAGLLVPVVLLAAPALEKTSRYATDKAAVFSEARLSALNESLAAFERETSNQIVVYVDRRLPADTTIEEVASATFRSWGIGQEGKSNGVLFLVFVDDRAMRVEVGYGLEGAIPDAIARRITSETVRPFFRDGDYSGGIEAGARALMAAARGEGFAGTGRTAAETPKAPSSFEPWTLVPPFLAGLVPLVVGLVRRPATGKGVPAVLATASAFATLVAFGTAALTGQTVLWILAGALLLATIGLMFVSFVLTAASASSVRSTASRATRRSNDDSASSASSASDGSSWSSTSSSDSSSDSSSSSSSDFSGGGGDSGGGGSSDNW